MAVLFNDPLLPITVTLNVPGSVLVQDSVEVCVAPRVTLVGDRMQFRLGEETARVRSTFPENPLIGAIVIVELPATFAGMLIEDGLAEMAKSWIEYVTVAL